jgi:hypothetical protein
MAGVTTRSNGDRRLFIDPRVIQEIVPYWTEEEAKACAKMIYGIVKMRVINGSDPAYEANDFVSGAYEGIMLAKKRYEKEGSKLKVEQCRGYLRSYTAEEVKKKKRSRGLDVMDSGRGNLVYDETAMEAPDKNSDAECQTIIEYIKRNYSHILAFARAYFEQEGNQRDLQKMFGGKYNKYQQQFRIAIKDFAARSQ